MQIEIDQSGKIEQTSLDTVVALTNDTTFTVLLKKKDKRVIEREYKKQKFHRVYKPIVLRYLSLLLLKSQK